MSDFDDDGVALKNLLVAAPPRFLLVGLMGPSNPSTDRTAVFALNHDLINL